MIVWLPPLYRIYICDLRGVMQGIAINKAQSAPNSLSKKKEYYDLLVM